MNSVPPLILTVRFDDRAASYFNALRMQYFPGARNMVPAHATLFHHLPGESLDRVADTIRDCCAGRAPIAMKVAGLRFLGRGVAYRLQSPGLSLLRRHLAQVWLSDLTAQDRQPFQPHITIQNKVAPEEARRLYDTLTASFQPREIAGAGLDLWHYLGGPWQHAGFTPFPEPPERPDLQT